MRGCNTKQAQVSMDRPDLRMRRSNRCIEGMIGVTNFKKAVSPNVFSVLAKTNSSWVVFCTKSIIRLTLSANVMAVSRSGTDKSSKLSVENRMWEPIVNSLVMLGTLWCAECHTYHGSGEQVALYSERHTGSSRYWVPQAAPQVNMVFEQ